MRSWFTYIFLLLAWGLVGTSCLDDPAIFGCNEERAPVKITLSFSNDAPASRDVDAPTQNGALDPSIVAQAAMNKDDVFVLVFSTKEDGDKIVADKLLYQVKDLTLNDPTEYNYYTRELKGTMLRTADDETVKIVILSNLMQNNITVNNTALNTKTAIQNYIDSMVGQTPQEIYENLIYNYDGTTTPWTLSATEGRRIPMWGETVATTVPTTGTSIDCFLYRAVAKVQIWVNEKQGIKGADGMTGTDDDFKITNIIVKNTNKKGYCASLETPNPNGDTQYTTPSVPDDVAQQDVTYSFAEGSEITTAYSDMIYLPEQFNSGKDVTPVTITVEYTYNGQDYTEDNGKAGNIEFKDDETKEIFHVIRNHSYIFNILKSDVTFEFTVEVAEWDDTPMQGITPQYTLTVDNSTFGFEGLTVTPGILNVTTDGTTWDYEKSQDVDNSWFTLGYINKKDNSGQITIIPSPNLTGAIRTGYFYVKAGKIGKKITVVQEPGETANCYIVRTPGDYLLKTDIKGNGNGEAWGDDTGETKVDISLETTGLAVDHVAILWETAEELVTIKTDEPDDNGLITYTVNDKKDQWKTSVFEPGHGGNALIGGFDENNKLVWSWHIWVVGDFANGIQTEQWVTGYDFMDRYLGAYSNEPGNRSLGLLYQWGRKDPFIGAANVGEVRNHSEIVKASTVNYTVHGVTYNWGDWATGTTENVQNSILNPTKILKSGFLSSGTGIIEFDEKALWGTTSSSINVEENGVKTLYDPCPPGYRVPSVHSWIFKRSNGTTTLYDTNYKWNCRYVPYRGNDGFDASSYGSEEFTSNSPYYGFWLDYTVNESSSAPAVVRFEENGYQRAEWGTIKDTQMTPLTWLPLGGVYSGTMDEFATVDEYSDWWYNYDGYSSLQVNSIIWLNAPSHRANNRPAGIFLHGTEGYRYKDDDNNGAKGNGRHLHELDETDTGLMALPQYAGSVRCIRDKDAVVSANNVISASNITLSSANSYSYKVTITAVESWRVTNPGAKWVVISPDNGNIGTTTITISSEVLTSGSSPEEATITIQFARGSTKEIKVTRQY